MAVYEILEEVAQERKLSIADIARICNLPDSTVRGIFRRKQESIALAAAFKLSDGLGISLEKLNGMPEKLLPASETNKAPSISDEALKLAEDYGGRMDDRGRETVRGVADLEVARFKTKTAATLRESRGQMEAAEELDIYSIPLYSLPMSAGTGQIAAQEYPEDFLLKKRPPRGTSFIARVSGNSMEPTYHDGDLVFVHATVDIRPGQTGAFLMDGQLWIKELGDGVLISHNPDYEPRQFTEDIRCQGLVLGVCDESYFE